MSKTQQETKHHEFDLPARGESMARAENVKGFKPANDEEKKHAPYLRGDEKLLSFNISELLCEGK